MKGITRREFVKISTAGSIGLSLAGLGLSDPASYDEIEPPTRSPEVQALYLKGVPDIDGKVSLVEEAPWVPIVHKDWRTDEASVVAWFQLGWHETGLYVAAALPKANLGQLLGTGRTPDAPFLLHMNLDLQPTPAAGEAGRYRLRFVPLVRAPSKMIYRSQAFLFNHRFGDDADLNDPGLVIWHEQSLSGIQPDGLLTRWGRMSGRDRGLTFEAYIPWKSVGVAEGPPETAVFFDLEVDLPGYPSSASWVGDVRKTRDTGSEIRRLEPDEPFSLRLYESRSLLLSSPGEVLLQGDATRAVFPVPEAVMGGLELHVVDENGKSTGRSSALRKTQPNVFEAEIELPDVADGGYALQVRRAQTGEVVSRKPIYLAGKLIRRTLQPRKERLLRRLRTLRDAGGPAWMAGYLARTELALERSNLPRAISVDDLHEARRLLDEARRLLDAVAKGQRPDTDEGYRHPAGFVADGRRGPITFVPVEEGTARLSVDAGPSASWQVSPLIYGTFSEPVVFDRPIYGMLYAQRLRNSSFEWGHPTFETTCDAYVHRYQEIDPEAARQVRRGQWVPILNTDENAVAAPWIGIGAEQTEFFLYSEAYNTRQSQAIRVRDASTGTGIAQLISLPIWRENHYRFRGHFRTDSGALTVRLKLYFEGAVIDQVVFTGVNEEWKAYEAVLMTPKREHRRNGFLLALVIDGPGTLYADQVTLYPMDAIDGMDPQVVEQLRKLKTGWIRWPGGNYASEYHWKGGVGPLKDRVSTPNPSWIGLNAHFFGTDEYMRLNQQADLEPLITVNAGTGSPDEAADWVEYCNGPQDTPMGRWRAENGHPEPYEVKYWNIGNELWGSWQGGYCTPAEYVRRYRAFVQAMRARDPSLAFIAVAVGPFSLGSPVWTDVLLEQLGSELDVIDFHAYVRVPDVPQLDERASLNTLVAIPVAYEQALMEFREKTLSMGLDDVQVAVGEYNSSPSSQLPKRWQEVGDLLSYAGWLHAFIRQGEYVMGANATEYSVFDPRAGVFDTLHPRYDLFRIYRRFAGSKPVRATLETPVRQSPYRFGKDVTPIFNLPLLDAVVLRDPEDGSLGIGIMNRDLKKAHQVQIDLKGYHPQKEAVRYLFWDEGAMDHGDEDAEKPTFRREPLVVTEPFTVSVPPHSVSLIKMYPTPTFN